MFRNKEPYKSVYESIKQGDLPSIKENSHLLVEKTQEGTLVSYLAEQGDHKSINLLLNEYIGLENVALIGYARGGYFDRMHQLLTYFQKNSIGTFLEQACFLGLGEGNHLDKIISLLSKETNPELLFDKKVSAINGAAERGHLFTLKGILEGEKQQLNALLSAALISLIKAHYNETALQLIGSLKEKIDVPHAYMELAAIYSLNKDHEQLCYLFDRVDEKLKRFVASNLILVLIEKNNFGGINTLLNKVKDNPIELDHLIAMLLSKLRKNNVVDNSFILPPTEFSHFDASFHPAFTNIAKQFSEEVSNREQRAPLTLFDKPNQLPSTSTPTMQSSSSNTM